ncbi:hypothetical protein [Paenibacillus sp. IHBB 10380]|uniref:hypothetical protein n=1 Tax=Paenibacillus sp. IHBB 10380 TaxID=1566358 RepID=UPI0005CFB81C|nr:hypothetical protein [Paenibacillus sp. IHBB 10380]AJS58085.1 membrane protein [Paenibacillus sp. IHBB 10380]
MKPNHNKILALMLNVVPGLGHYYLGRKGRAVIYPFLFFGSIILGFMMYFASNGEEMILFLTAVIALFFWGINMLDLLISLLRQQPNYIPEMPLDYGMPPQYESHVRSGESERFYTILLSFIPGLGHLQLGLMQRGLSFLVAFFGLLTIMLFVTGLTSQSIFLLFLGVLPIIWLYCMFDAVQQVHRKQAGEVLVDRTLFEEFESGREVGKRSKILATLLSAFPGAGHMYVGLQKRGLQLMILFLGSIYILDILRLSVFLFLIPVIWFFSFFDALQQISRYGREPMQDRPLIDGIENHRRWIGIVLLGCGIYYISSSLIIPLFESWFPDWHIEYRVRTYMRTFIVSLLLLAGGIKLLLDNKTKKKQESRLRR